jgi:hypothetical protein
VQPLWKATWRILKKLKIELPYDPLLGIYTKEYASGYDKATCIPMFIAALFITAKLWRQPRCPMTDSRLRKCDLYIQWSFIQP